MFNFSSKTFVNKEYKVSDFLRQIRASKEVKEDAKKISRIIFQNVINADTLNVLEDKEYKNIYIIKIKLKTVDIPKLFIEALDKTIEFHTYFVFEYNNKFASMIAFKEISQKVKISSKYYEQEFIEERLVDVPKVNSVKDAYRFLLEYEIGLKAREEESPFEYIKRIRAINKLEFQINKTEKGIIYETQPKKKFEYNERLRRYKRNLEELKGEEE